MKFRVFALLTSIFVVAVLLFGAGLYIQKQIMEPYGIEHDYSILELPFVVVSDEALRFSIDQAMSGDGDDDDYYNDLFDDWFGDLETNSPALQPDESEIETTPDTEPEPDISTTEPETSEPETSEPETTSKPSKDPKSDTYPVYDFSDGAVDESWYDDVLFVGDSRMIRLRDYARAGKADYFCVVGMSVFNYDTKVCSDNNFSNKTLEELLQTKTYGKILINLGLNELGYSASSIVKKYMQLLDMVKKYQPDADIIIQSVMPVTKSYADSLKYPDSFTPSNVGNLNKYLKAMAEKYGIYYIDANDYFSDSDGWLYSELSRDGCHLKAAYAKDWAAWISFAVGEYY